MAREPALNAQEVKRLREAQRRYEKSVDRIKFDEVQGYYNEDEITGKEDFLQIGRSKVKEALQQRVGKEKRRSDIRTPDFKLPVVRSARPKTNDGRTSFHFSHEAISKTKTRTVAESGLVNEPGAAKRHNRYIERDGAVAHANEIESDLARLLGIDPEADPEKLKDPYALVTPEALAKGVENGTESLAGLHGQYVERQEALARHRDGSQVLFTNISQDPLERAAVWDEIEKFERDPDPDRMRVVFGENPAFWEKVINSRKCPQSIVRAYESDDHSLQSTFQIDDGGATRQFLRSFEEWDDKKPFADFVDGRGGRVQYRIIGELPYDLTVQERSSILREFSKEFEDRKLPYVAVMHEPDHTNDDRNWHFHLIYYDRPISKMPDGRWDFTVSEEYVDKKYNRRIRWPHRQNKLDEVSRDKNWIPKLRKRLAEITNDHLERAHVDRRLDPRTYSEMGIHRNPQEHLGTRHAALEAMGTATPVGYENANKEWDALIAGIAARRDASQRSIEATANKWLSQIDRRSSDPDENDEQKKLVQAWKQTIETSHEYRFMADTMHTYLKKQLSRAEKVVKTCERRLDAINRDVAKPYEKSRSKAIQKRLDEALKHISRTQTEFQREMLIADDCERNAERIAKQAEELRARIIVANQGAGQGSHESIDKARQNLELLIARREKEKASGKESGKKDNEKYLDKKEMDRWMGELASLRRRLRHDGTRIVPAEVRETDRHILASKNYGLLGKRLAALKRDQDKLIADIAGYLKSYPWAASIGKDADGRAVMKFKAPKPLWDDAFKSYANEPEIVAAHQQAMIENERSKKSVRERDKAPTKASQAAKPAPTPERAPEAPARPQEQRAAPAQNNVPPKTVKAEKAAPVPTPAPVLHRAIDRVASEAIRLRTVNGVITPDPVLLQQLGIEREDLITKTAQQRLQGIYTAQVRELRRLESYAEKFPGKFREENGRIEISRTAPPELVAIADKWKTDPEEQERLRALVKPTKGAVILSDKTGGEGRDNQSGLQTPASAEGGAGGGEEAPVSDKPDDKRQQPSEPKKADPIARRTDAPTPEKIEPKPAEPKAPEPVVAQKPEPVAKKLESANEAPRSRKPASRSQEGEKPVDRAVAQSRTEPVSRPVPEKPRSPKPAEPAKPVVEGKPNEVKQPELPLLPSGTQEPSKAPTPVQKPAKAPVVEPASGDMPSTKPAAPKKPARVEHAKVYAYANAVKENRPKAVQEKLAAAVLSDPAAVASLDGANKNMVRRIRQDAETYRKSQEISRILGRDPGKGR